MTWRYRVFRKDGNYTVGEHYDLDDGPAWVSEPVAPMGESQDELRQDLMHMLSALNLPVLEDRDGTLMEVEPDVLPEPQTTTTN